MNTKIWIETSLLGLYIDKESDPEKGIMVEEMKNGLIKVFDGTNEGIVEAQGFLYFLEDLCPEEQPKDEILDEIWRWVTSRDS